MKITELRLKIRERDKKRELFYPPKETCCWNPMAEEAPQKEDSYLEEEYVASKAKRALPCGPVDDTVYLSDDEEHTDEEQNLREALSLLSRARFWLIQQTKFLDARNLALPDDGDWRVTVLAAELTQFLSFFDVKEITKDTAAKEEEKPKSLRKTTAMGPAAMKGVVSHECRHTRHNWCPLVNCDCPCHKEEFQNTEEQLGRKIALKLIEEEEKKEKGLAPL